MNPIDKIYLIDNRDKFSEVNFPYSIEKDLESNSIRFKIQAKNFSHGYVVGDFNDWQKTKAVKLTWQADSRNSSLWLANTIFDIKNLKPLNNFTFILVDIKGNESKISLTNDKFSPLTFDWQSIERNIQIKASNNFLIKGFPLEVIAIEKSITGFQSIVDVEWQITPQSEDLKFKNNRITVTKDSEIDEITVTCYSKTNPKLTATKVFKSKEINTKKSSLIHFIRRDGCFKGHDFSWDLWTYNEGKKATSTELNIINDFGVAAFTSKTHVIARKKMWGEYWHNDWAEQTLAYELTKQKKNYYIVHGDGSNIYRSLEEVIHRLNPRITYSTLNKDNKIRAYLSDTPRVGTVFELWINSTKIDDIETFVDKDNKQLLITNLPADIKPYHLIEIRANNTFMPNKVLIGSFLDKFYYPHNDMGVSFEQDSVSLRLWAPTAKKVELLLYRDEATKDKSPEHIYDLNMEHEYGTHSIKLERSLCEDAFYLYRLHFDDIDANGNVYTKVTYARDPYAIGLSVNGRRGCIVDINSDALKPDNWHKSNYQKLSQPQDAIIYETHIRDFSISTDSGVDDGYRGKYLGMVQSGTCYESEKQKVSTTIDSIAELGITHLHLLPFFDFSSVDETKLSQKNNRNWGYDPENYNAPDGSYSIDPYDPNQRIKGVRTMISKLHDKQIAVVMDVVYNHMTDTSNFGRIVPKYYFRTDKYGNFTNGSGCGNEVASEKPMVRKFIIDSIIHWIKNYKIDGLRFDLMELIDLDTIKQVIAKAKELNPNCLIYGEPWKADYSPLSNGTYRGTQKNQGFAIFNDIFRDAIRGNNDPGRGFINGDAHNPEHSGKLIEGLKGSIHTLAAKTSEIVNYVDAHDNYTLWDQIEKSQNYSIKPSQYRKNIPDDIFESHLVRQNALAIGMVLTSQGIPFIHGGSEFLRTKKGDHNSYKSNDEINAFHWADKLTYKPFFDYVKGLITLRKNHPSFRTADPNIIKKSLDIYNTYHDTKSGVLISHFKDNMNNDSWQDIIIIYNGSSIDYDVNIHLPKIKATKWHIVVDHQKAGIDTIAEVDVGKLPVVKSYSMMVIHS